MNVWEATENFQGPAKIYYENLTKYFKKYKNDIFVETGTFLGNGLQCALNVGFKKCYSIEIHNHLHEKAKTRFKKEIKNGTVELFKGDSSIVLKTIIPRINSPATFWIDAHISAQYGEKLAKNCPIFEELNHLFNHHIKTHVLLIDDLNCFGKKKHDKITIQQVQDKILQINPNYKFNFLDVHIPKNIMVAFV